MWYICKTLTKSPCCRNVHLFLEFCLLACLSSIVNIIKMCNTSQCHLFSCTTINKMPRNTLKKWRHHPHLFFFCRGTAKSEDIALKSVFVLFVCILITCIPFFGYLENVEFYWQLFLKRSKFWFGGNIKIWDNHSVERLIWRRLAFFDCFLLQNWTF